VKTHYTVDDNPIAYWDARHVKWDESPDIAIFKAKDAWFEARFSHILPQERLGTRVLDFGSGCGMYSVPLLRRFDSYFGVDTSRKAVEIANRYFGNAQTFFDHLYRWPMRLPYGDEKFDCAISITCLQHMPIDWRLAAIDEIKRVLQPGGRYIGLEWIGQTAAWDMPPMDEGEWIEAWKPLRIVPDLPSEHPDYHADHVWLAELPKD